MAVVALLDILRCGERGFHRCQQLTPVLHEQVQGAQHIVLRISLAKLTERGLEVVGYHGQVVVGSTKCALRLVQGDTRRTLRVGATVIHIIAKEIAARTQLDECHRIGIVSIDIGTAVIGRSHSAPQFAGEVRIAVSCWLLAVGCWLRIVNLIRSYGCTGTKRFEVKGFVVVAAGFCHLLVPEAVGIVAIERKHLSERYGGGKFGPTRACVERQVETYLEGYLLERHQVLTTSPVLIVELGSDDRSAVLPLQALDLSENLTV